MGGGSIAKVGARLGNPCSWAGVIPTQSWVLQGTVGVLKPYFHIQGLLL